MKRFLLAVLTLSSFVIGHSSFAAEPLRIFIRSGPKSHGPGAHDYPQFLKDWVPMLNERGAKASGKNGFPTKEELDATDVLVLHSQEAGNIAIGEERKNLLDFLKRGGGIVVIHAGAVSRDPVFFKGIVGGSWNHETPTKWLEAPMSLYFTDRENPITKDIANFDMDDEIYYDMDILPEVKVLAGAYTPNTPQVKGGNKEAQARAAEAVAKKKGVNIYDIQPQMWTYEKDDYRAFVCIPGHYYKNFSHNGLRTAILRGIAWAGKRENADLLCKPEELGDALRYVEGGPPAPKDLPQHLEVHPEFNISLVASEPLINKPMNIDWDERGRLWVVETPEYPNGLRQANVEAWKDSGSFKPGQYERKPQDRVSILSDTNGDGVMDRKQVFADEIELATSSVFYKNGIIVCAAPDIWFFEDTNGDDKADKRSKLYTNLGNRDTHAVINNMRWGLDGWVYATHGYSSSDNVQCLGGSQGEKKEVRSEKEASTASGNRDASHLSPLTSHSSPVGIGAGVVRFKPDGSAIEQYASRGGNTWGLDITWDGQVFYTQPTSGNHFIHVVLPEYVLAKGKLPGVMGTNGILPREPTYPAMHWEQQAYVQIDQVGSYTAAAGCAIYEGGAWPAKWNYGYFTTEPTVNIVSHFMVEPDGVTYKAKREPGREQTEFIRSRNLWFRPIENRVGPDGALYIVDFCNQAVIHNDTRGPVHGPANAAVRPDRDHYYGRIWKVQHKEAKKVEVPVLDKSSTDKLLAVLHHHPNEPTKQTAQRLLNEMNKDKGFEDLPPLDELIRKRKTAFSRRSPAEMKASMQLAIPYMENASDLSVKMTDYLNWAEFTQEPTVRDALLSRYANAKDDWMRSALIATASYDASLFISNAISHARAKELGGMVQALIPKALADDGVSLMLLACADAPNVAGNLKSIILQALAQQAGISLTATPALKEPLQKLLANPATSTLALPLVAKWDTKGEMAEVVKAQVASLSAVLGKHDAPLPQRISAAKALIALGGANAQTGVEAMADPTAPEELRRAIIAALDESGNTTPLVAAFDTLNPQLQSTAFDVILKRPEATLALLKLIEDGGLKPSDIDPGNVARLRTHPNKQVALRANKMLEKLSPITAEKNKLIAQLTPEVEKPGDAAKGKVAYALCATCHKLGDIGLPVGPPLDGMGAHGPAELLVHIVDPNREVDPSFWAHNITTKKGDVHVGVITSENASTVTLATQAGVKEIAKSDIATRENTRRSLMPEGLEAMGAEALRDLLAFICGDALKHFRILDLKPAFTADSREGVFAGPQPNQGQVRLAKYGNVSVNGIPFFIQDAAKSATGSNIIVLKGGPQKSQSWTFPQRVEVAVNAEAKKLHLLSGIAGWGFPAVREEIPAMKATVTYASGETEEFVMKNGIEFADYIREVEVPGSQLVEGGISADQQVRLLSLTLTKKGVIKTLALESFANGVAPVVIAVTADVEGSAGTPARNLKQGGEAAKKNEADKSVRAPLIETGPKEGGKGDGPLVAATPPQWEAGKTKVLIIGGGSSHDFAKFFGGTDSATLKAAGFSVHYTEDRDQAASELKNADIAVISVNRKFFDTAAYRKALFDFAAAGKGIVMLHPGTWYGFAGWPELNAKIVGGGARGHDKIHPFDVKALKPDHPVMQGVPASFTVEDELYYVNAEPDKIPAGTAPIEVLAETSPSDKYKAPHPSVWLTKHDKARIVGIALGHDARTHELEPFKKLLSNAVKWASGK